LVTVSPVKSAWAEKFGVGGLQVAQVARQDIIKINPSTQTVAWRASEMSGAAVLSVVKTAVLATSANRMSTIVHSVWEAPHVAAVPRTARSAVLQTTRNKVTRTTTIVYPATAVPQDVAVLKHALNAMKGVLIMEA
jgi:hypothetical protein